MKNILTAIGGLMVCMNIYAQGANNDIQTAASKYQSLSQAIENASADMLAHLPITFSEYVNLWGDSGPLYEQPNIIRYLYQNEYVDQNILMNKVVLLSRNAYWDADHVSELQTVMQDMAISHSFQLIRILNQKDETVNKSFWRFVFSGPHPNNYQPMKNKILSIPSYKRYKYIGYIQEQYDHNIKNPIR